MEPANKNKKGKTYLCRYKAEWKNDYPILDRRGSRKKIDGVGWGGDLCAGLPQ